MCFSRRKTSRHRENQTIDWWSTLTLSASLRNICIFFWAISISKHLNWLPITFFHHIYFNIIIKLTKFSGENIQADAFMLFSWCCGWPFVMFLCVMVSFIQKRMLMTSSKVIRSNKKFSGKRITSSLHILCINCHWLEWVMYTCLK